MLVTMSTFAIVGMSAVTATSCNIPTSLITRTTRSPVFALVWKESERYWTWRYSCERTLRRTRLSICAKPIVCQYEATERRPVIATTATAATASAIMGSMPSKRGMNERRLRWPLPRIRSNTNFNGHGSRRRRPTSAKSANREAAIKPLYLRACGQKYLEMRQRPGSFSRSFTGFAILFPRGEYSVLQEFHHVKISANLYSVSFLSATDAVDV